MNTGINALKSVLGTLGIISGALQGHQIFDTVADFFNDLNLKIFQIGKLKSIVSQESIINLLLFVIVINDLCIDNLNKCELFADNTKVIVRIEIQESTKKLRSK